MIRTIYQQVKDLFNKNGGSKTQQRGYQGETEAVKNLKKNGIKIRERNWRYKKGEIDIIGDDGGVLVFIEVKSRNENRMVPGYYAVTKKKKDSLQPACKAYLRGLKVKPRHWRFDIIEVKLCKGRKNCLNHYKNVPLFSKHFH